MTRILNLETHDLRFPTSIFLDGSDAMNPDPDYSAAYVILSTDHPRGLAGHGFTFTIGRGNEICVAAIEAFRPFIVGRSLDEIIADMSGFWRSLAGDSQLRWLGPEKGVIHLALAAVVNAVWDLWAKSVGKPVWKLVADLTPEQFVSLIDFRHIEDVLTPRGRARDPASPGCGQGHPRGSGCVRKAIRPTRLRSAGSATTTTRCAGCAANSSRKAGSTSRSKSVVTSREDLRRCALVREEIGPDRRLMIDANQVWEVNAAIPWLRALSEFDPWWIEEPVSPDDILGHGTVARAVRPMRVATGEHVHNRIMFKQLLASDAIDVVQPDACRLGGLNEVLAVLLLAAKFGKPVCPHAGGVGLCEYAQHISMIDFVVVSGSWEEAMCEHTQHLHEHFVHPIEVHRGRYAVPLQPGFSAQMRSKSIAEATYKG